MTHPRRAAHLGAALTLLVVLLVSCGSDPDETTDPTVASSTPTSTAAGTGTGTGGGDTTTSHLTLPPADGDGDSTGETDASDEPGGATDPTAAPPDQAPLPTSAPALAANLVEAEEAVRAATAEPATVAAWARRQQHLYRVLATSPDWEDEVVAAVPPHLSEAVTLNVEARRHLDALLGTETLHDTLPAWRIDDPRPAPELLGYYREASEATGVPWSILAAINLIETRMGRISGVSTAGAIGPMQFLPTTWAECCDGDPTDPHDAIRGAAEYLIDRGAARDLDRAIWGYNNSDHYVGAVRAYAAVLDLDERAYTGYHAWEVHYLSTEGLVWLPVGYEEASSVDVATWLAANPASLIPLTP